MPLLLRKELLLPEWWPPMRFLRCWWQMAQLEPFELEDGPRKVMPNSPLRREEKSSLKSWSFQSRILDRREQRKGPQLIGQIP